MAGLERWPRQRRLLSEKNKNMTALLGFANMHMNKPHDFWNNFLLTDDTEVEMFGHNAAPDVWYTTHNISAQTSPSAMHSAGGVLIWAFPAATEPGHLHSLSQTPLYTKVY